MMNPRACLVEAAVGLAIAASLFAFGSILVGRLKVSQLSYTYVVLQMRDEGGTATWYVHPNYDTPICGDAKLPQLLRELGSNGFQLIASGGAHPGTGVGPTRLILSKVTRAAVPREEKFLRGPEERTGSPSSPTETESGEGQTAETTPSVLGDRSPTRDRVDILLDLMLSPSPRDSSTP